MRLQFCLLLLTVILATAQSVTPPWLDEFKAIYEANYTHYDRLFDIAQSLEAADRHDTATSFAEIGPLAFPSNNGSSLSNGSVSGTGDGDGPDNRKGFRYRLGGPRQHIGTLRKNRLFETIYRAILVSCDQTAYTGACCEKCRGKDGDVSTKISPIVYNESGRGRYRTNAHLTLSIGYAVRDPKYVRLFEQMARMVAFIYMMECELNLYTIDFIGSRRTTMCNVGRSVTVVAPLKEERKVFLLRVKISFNGATAEGPWSCDENMREQTAAAADYTGFERKTAEMEGLSLKDFKQRTVECFENDCDQIMHFHSDHC